MQEFVKKLKIVGGGGSPLIFSAKKVESFFDVKIHNKLLSKHDFLSCFFV